MSDSQNAGFGKFVPGFDFLQNLAKGASDAIPQMPNITSWIAPTLSVEELDKRISELKTVHFWLDQNSKALSATIQALEVQKMTLATLKGMNVNIGDMANVFKSKAEAVKAPASKTISELAEEAEAAAHKVREASQAESTAAAAATPESTPTPAMVDPIQLWGALTQQFQTIAASALKEVGANAAIDATKSMATEIAKEAVQATKKAVASVVSGTTTAKPATKAPAKAAVKSAAKPAAKKVAKKVAK